MHMNDRIDDASCVTTIHVPQLRTNAAAAKHEKRMMAKSRSFVLQIWFGERLVQ